MDSGISTGTAAPRTSSYVSFASECESSAVTGSGLGARARKSQSTVRWTPSRVLSSTTDLRRFPPLALTTLHPWRRRVLRSLRSSTYGHVCRSLESATIGTWIPALISCTATLMPSSQFVNITPRVPGITPYRFANLNAPLLSMMPGRSLLGKTGGDSWPPAATITCPALSFTIRSPW